MKPLSISNKSGSQNKQDSKNVLKRDDMSLLPTTPSTLLSGCSFCSVNTPTGVLAMPLPRELNVWGPRAWQEEVFQSRLLIFGEKICEWIPCDSSTYL